MRNADGGGPYGATSLPGGHPLAFGRDRHCRRACQQAATLVGKPVGKDNNTEPTHRSQAQSDAGHRAESTVTFISSGKGQGC